MANNGILQAKNSKYLPASTTSYNATCDDDFIYVDTSLNAVTIVLPNIRNSLILENPKCFKINDYSGNASVNNITIVGCGGDVVNSGASVVIDSDGGSAETNAVSLDEWFVVKDYTVAPTTYTFQNALTESANVVKWGGALTEDTYIDGAYSVYFGLNSRITDYSILISNNYIIQSGDNFNYGNSIAVDPAKIELYTAVSPNTNIVTVYPTYTNFTQNITLGSSITVYGVTSTGATGTGNLVFATSPTFGTQITTPLINGVSGALSFANAAQSSGALTSFSFTSPNNTGQTASTNIPNFRVNGSTKTWAAGTITNQYWNYFSANTAAFASASTITNSYGLYVEAATAGTNATITNNYAAGFSGGIQIQDGSISNQGIVLRSLVGSATNSAIYMGVKPSSTNYAIRGDSTGNTFVSGGQLFLCVGGTSQVVMNGASISFQSNNIQTSGVTIQYKFSPVNNTNQTASTEIPLFAFNGATTTWATGAITTLRNFWVKSRTLAFGGASTVTNSYGAYFEAATAGTNATINNNYAAGFSGNVNILSGNLFNSGTQVVGTRNTGWTAMTGSTDKATSLDTGTLTLAQLAQRVAALQAALTTHGLIGV